MNNQELKHYGIPGMRWGHRKKSEDSNQVGLFRRKKQQSEDYDDENNQVAKSEDAKRYNELKNKQISELTNSELLWVTQRMQLEQNYKSSANRENREKIEKAKQAIGDISFIAENVRKIAQTVDYFKGKGPKPDDGDGDSIVDKIKEKHANKAAKKDNNVKSDSASSPREPNSASSPREPNITINNVTPSSRSNENNKSDLARKPKSSLKNKSYTNLKSGNQYQTMLTNYKSYYNTPRTEGTKVMIGQIKKKKK